MKKTSRYPKATGIYVHREDLEQMVLHYFYREGMTQTQAARTTGIPITVAHNIVNRIEIQSKPEHPEKKPTGYVFSLEEIPRIGEAV